MAFSPSPFHKTTKIWVLAGVAGLFAISALWYIRAIRTPETVDLRKFGNQRDSGWVDMPQDDVHLNEIPMANTASGHQLDGDFKTVYRVSDISRSCWNSFNSSFVSNLGKNLNGEVPFADPGQPAQYGDSLIPDAPFRQLVFAGQSPRTCFVYFQHGGVNHPSYCLAVMDNAIGKPIWAGEVRKKVRNLRELRSLLSTHQFDDTSGPNC
jgi:hypothetical protein